MKQQKEMTNTPPEQTAAEALREAVTAFAKSAATRSKHDSAHLEAVQVIADIAKTFVAVNDEATYPPAIRRFGMPYREERKSATVRAAVLELRRLTTAVETSSIAGVVVETPAIANEAVRRAVVKLCEDIVTAIDDALECAREREASKAEERIRLADSIRFMLAHPVIGQLIRAALAYIDGGFNGAEPAIAAAINAVQTQHAEILRGHTFAANDWDAWMPIARQILSETEGTSRRAA